MTAIASSIVTPPVSVTTPADFYRRDSVAAIPGTTQTVFSFVVPAGIVRKLTGIVVVSENDGYFSLQANGLEIATGRIDNVMHNIFFKFDPPRPIAAGVTISLVYTSSSEPNYPCPITSFLSANDFTI